MASASPAGQAAFPDIVSLRRELSPGRVDQRKRAVEPQLIDEDRVRREGIPPAQGRPLPQRAACGDDGQHDRQGEHEPARGEATRRSGISLRGDEPPGAPVDDPERPGQQPGGQSPGQEVAQHREAVPEHAQDGLRIFLEVLEHQPVEALVEFPVEVQFDDAEEQRHAGECRQPAAHQPPRVARPPAGNGQQQRDAAQHHQPQVEAQPVQERLAHHASRGAADLLPVVNEQGQAQQRMHRHEHRHARQRECQVVCQGYRLGAGGGGDFCGRLVVVLHWAFVCSAGAGLADRFVSG